ncbi:MAG: hypothetical protein J6M02_05295 [Clostridia bacterium]|nr:hypothetical protein [Clostridia bacterium]
MVMARILLWLFLLIGFYCLGCRLLGGYYREKIFSERGERPVWRKKETLLKWGFLGVVMIMVFFSTFSVWKTLFYGVCGYGLLYVAERIKKAKEKKEVLIDVMNVCECLRVQLSSQIALNHALKNLAQLCKNQEFQRYLTDLFLEYELSKFTVSSSANKLARRFRYPEIKIFLSVLNQQMQGTSRLESLDNLIEILKEKYVEFLEDTTKNKIAFMTAGVFLIVVNLAAISVYPVVIESVESLRSILS